MGRPESWGVVLLGALGGCTLLIGGSNDYRGATTAGAGGATHASSSGSGATHGSGGATTGSSSSASTSSGSSGTGGAGPCTGAPAGQVCGIGRTCDAQGACQVVIPCGNTDGLQPNAVWPMFGYCPTHPGRSPYAGPTSAVLKWTAADANLAGGSIQPAIAADGTIYVGGYGSVWAIEPVHGKTKWTYSTANQPVRSTPAIGADGTIYVGTDGPTKFVALEPTHGQELWHYTAAANVGSSPLIGPDGSIYFGSDATDLYALDRTGAFMWQLPTMGAVGLSPALGLDGMRIYVGSGMTVFGVSPSAMFATTPNTIASSPVVGVAGVYVGTAVGGLWGLNADLTQQWFYPVSTNQPALDATPAIGPDGTVYVGGQTTTLTAVSHDGTFKWGFSTSGWIGSPTVDVNGLIYFGTRFPDSAVYALGPDMSLKWKIPFSGSLDLRAAPVIGADGTLYIGANNQSGTAPTLFAIGI